jgi:hypothetical protein
MVSQQAREAGYAYRGGKADDVTGALVLDSIYKTLTVITRNEVQ